MIYALVAVGYSLVFGVLRIMNMAYASILTLGAHFCLASAPYFGVFPGFAFALILTGLVSVFFDVSMLAPLRRKKSVSGITVLITAIGFNYVLLNLCQVIWGTERKPFQNIFDFGSFKLGSLKLDSTQLIIMGIVVLLLLVLSYIVYGTRIGLGMRAVQQNMIAAQMTGVDTKRIINITFFISGITACTAGFLVASNYQLVYSTMGVSLGSKAFAAAILGGIGILHGSVIGGIIIGVLECLSVYFFGGTYREAVAYIVLILVLLFMPQGLFGKHEANKL